MFVPEQKKALRYDDVLTSTLFVGPVRFAASAIAYVRPAIPFYSQKKTSAANQHSKEKHVPLQQSDIARGTRLRRTDSPRRTFFAACIPPASH